MRFTNHTPWDSNDLRKFFWACVQDVEKIEKPKHKLYNNQKYFTLQIGNTSSDYSRGRAWRYNQLHGNRRIVLKLPKCWVDSLYSISNDEMANEDKTILARLIIHEYYHILGYDYQDRNNYKHDFTNDWEVKNIIIPPIKIAEKKVKPKRDIRLVRYQQAKENLKKAETRYKRAETLKKKWKDKVKYYEKNYKVEM